jgi:hypothetical protein
MIAGGREQQLGLGIAAIVGLVPEVAGVGGRLDEDDPAVRRRVGRRAV